MRIIWGLLIIGLGLAVTLKSEALLKGFGSIQYFEEKFRSAGGSRFGYKLMGIIAIAIGTLVLTNLHTIVLTKFAQLLTPGA